MVVTEPPNHALNLTGPSAVNATIVVRTSAVPEHASIVTHWISCRHRWMLASSLELGVDARAAVSSLAPLRR
jgi:hypothetical protein